MTILKQALVEGSVVSLYRKDGRTYDQECIKGNEWADDAY